MELYSEDSIWRFGLYSLYSAPTNCFYLQFVFQVSLWFILLYKRFLKQFHSIIVHINFFIWLSQINLWKCSVLLNVFRSLSKKIILVLAKMLRKSRRPSHTSKMCANYFEVVLYLCIFVWGREKTGFQELFQRFSTCS